MTSVSKQHPATLLGRGVSVALLTLSSGCAVNQPVKTLPPAVPHHVEPLPLDEFGYLFPHAPPVNATPTLLAMQTPPTPATLVSVQPLPAATATPPHTAKPAAAQQITTRVLRFATRVPFKFNRAGLPYQDRVALLAFLNSLEQYRGVRSIRITGHTDRTGPVHYNRWLSKMRAQSVRLLFLAAGADPRTLIIRGTGNNGPRPAARSDADDRYVDIEVVVRAPLD